MTNDELFKAGYEYIDNCFGVPQVKQIPLLNLSDEHFDIFMEGYRARGKKDKFIELVLKGPDAE